MLTAGGILTLLHNVFRFPFEQSPKKGNDPMTLAKALISAQQLERKQKSYAVGADVNQNIHLLKKQLQFTQTIMRANQEHIEKTQTQVKLIHPDLHSFFLNSFGLRKNIEIYLEKVANRFGLITIKAFDPIIDSIPQEKQVQIFLTIQEAIYNVIQHAQASAVSVDVLIKKGLIDIKIMDNGKGFDPELTLVKMPSKGLKIMNERIQSIGGQFRIQSHLSNGTLILITIPKL